MSSVVQGVGVGLRRSFCEELLQRERSVDWIEIVAENFAGLGGRPARTLARCAERWPIVAHGVSLSIGGDGPVGAQAPIKSLLRSLAPPFFTDHLCYSSVGGHQTFDLLPVPFHADAVRYVGQRARQAQEQLETPLLLENITYYATMPGSDMDEPDFIRAVLEEADCGLLLDLNNLYVNAINHGHEPHSLLARMPLERTRQIHLAGFTRSDSVLLDTHSRPVCSDVWGLYGEALRRTGAVPTLIEWDQDIPSLDAVLSDVDLARAMMREAGRAFRRSA